MRDQLEQELRRLITKFEADVRRAVLRSLHAALDPALGLGAGLISPDPDTAARTVHRMTRAAEATHRPRRRASHPTRTTEEMAHVRAQVTAVIRQQPDQSTAELARTVGVTSNQLRPQLRQLADEGVISIAEHDLGGVKRHTYRAAELHPVHHAEPLLHAVGASA